jgi:hypothetical protein
MFFCALSLSPSVNISLASPASGMIQPEQDGAMRMPAHIRRKEQLPCAQLALQSYLAPKF